MLAFNALGYALRYDLVIILSLLPLTLGLFFKFRKEDSKADSILVLILTALLAGPVFAMLTSFLEIGFPVLPYRFLPLIVFVAVGIGVLLSRKN
jgi:FtsH-binding integral membrane protein